MSRDRVSARGGAAGFALPVVTLVLVLATLLAATPAAPAAGPAPGAGPVHRVNVNTAGVEELQSLPRIGPALARRIVEYRQKAGPFRRVEDLLAVRGIGPKLLARIRGRVTVGRPRDGARGAAR